MHKISWILWILIIVGAVFLYAHVGQKGDVVDNSSATTTPIAMGTSSEDIVQVISMSSTTPVVITSTTTTATSGTITLAVGQTTQVAGLTLTLNSFVQDNRCPADVQCIEAGAVTVNLTAVQKGQTTTENFASDEAPHKFGQHTVSIIDIKPERKSQQEITQKQYRITFRIELH